MWNVPEHETLAEISLSFKHPNRLYFKSRYLSFGFTLLLVSSSWIFPGLSPPSSVRKISEAKWVIWKLLPTYSITRKLLSLSFHVWKSMDVRTGLTSLSCKHRLFYFNFLFRVSCGRTNFKVRLVRLELACFVSTYIFGPIMMITYLQT